MNYKSTLPEGAKELLTHYYCTGNAEHATKVRNMLYQNFDMELIDDWIYDQFHAAKYAYGGSEETDADKLLIMRTIITDMAMSSEDNPSAIAMYAYALITPQLISTITHCLECDFDLVEILIDTIRIVAEDPESAFVDVIDDPTVINRLQALIGIYEFIDAAKNEILDIDEADQRKVLDIIADEDEDADGCDLLDYMATEKYNWPTMYSLFRQLINKYVADNDFALLEKLCDRFLDNDTFEVTDASTEMLQMIMDGAIAYANTHNSNEIHDAYYTMLSVMTIIESWCSSVDDDYSITEDETIIEDIIDVLNAWKKLLERTWNDVAKTAKGVDDLSQAKEFYDDAITAIDYTIEAIDFDDEDEDDNPNPKTYLK